MNNNKIGFAIYITTMLIFLGLYFFGMNTDYFNNSLIINAFVLPIVYLAGAYISVNALKKTKAHLSFKDVFGRAFKPMFMGGLLSVLSIYLFLNFADRDAKDLLNFQYVERQKTELNKEYEKANLTLKTDEEKAELRKNYENRLQSFSPEMIKDKDMFTLQQFSYYFAAILIFYVILSVFFASFFRSITPH